MESLPKRPSKVLSLERMSRRLGVTSSWLSEQANAGNVPHIKAGKRYLFNPDATENRLAERSSRGTNDNSEVSNG